MDIIFKMVGAFEIDDQDNLFYIKASCTDTGGNHDRFYSLFKIVDCELSISGVHCPMQDKRIITIFYELLVEEVCLGLFIDEDQDTAFLVPVA